MHKKAFSIGILLCCLFLVTVSQAQEIRIIPKNKSAAYLSRMSVSLSVSYIAARLFKSPKVSIFQSLSRKEVKRIVLDQRPQDFYLLNDNGVLAAFNYNITGINNRDMATVAEWKSDGMSFTANLNVKNKVLAISTLSNTTTTNCAENRLQVLATISTKLSDRLFFEDGRVLAGLQENKIICWTVKDLQINGSLDTSGINAFEASSSVIITIKRKLFSYACYNFDGTLRSSYKEIREVTATYIANLSSTEVGFL